MALLTNINGKFSVSDAGAVTFNNAFTFPTADGNANYVLQTNGSGQIGWAENGSVTGSGSATRVAFWSSGSAITSDADLYWDNTNKRLGIGTDSPDAELHVEGNIELQPSWEIGSNNGTYWQRIRTVDGSATTDNAFNFETRNGSGSYITHMVIRNDGRVGIGVAQPTAPLDVNGNIYSSSRVQGGVALMGTSGAYATFGSNSTTRAIAISRDYAPTSYPDIIVSANGKVGIGTVAPSAQLQINSTTNAGGVSVAAFLVNESITVGTETRLAFAANTNNDIASGRYSYISTVNTSGSNGQAMTFATNESGASAVERMRIDSVGNVEISTDGINKGAILMQNSHFVNKRFSFDPLVSNAPTAYMILCEYAPNQDVNGIITMDRTSGLRHACSIQVLISSGSGTSPVAGLKAMGVAGASTPFYQLVTCDYDDGTGSSSHIAVQMSNPDGYYETSGAYFTGRIVNSNNGIIVPVLPAAVSNVAVFETNCRHDFQGDVGFNQGKVGIGTTATPGRMLEVNGGTTNDGGIKLSCSANLSNYWSGIEFSSSVATSFIYMASDDADGTLNFLPDASLKGTLSKAGTWTVAADVIAYGSPSDKRLKENIKPIESALDKVMKLEGVTFDWIQKEDQILDIKEDIGFIAQDVQKVVPDLIRENEDGMLSMRHQGIAPILLEAIKELKAEIEELKLNKCNCNCNK